MLILKAFSENDFTKLFNFTAEVYITAPDEMILEYMISGPTRHLHFPPSHGHESRRDELWKTTCLEAFLSPDFIKDSSYLEINCSPNGDWNAYSFSGYRAGMTPAAATEVKLIGREADQTTAHFRIRIKSPGLDRFKHLGVTAVVEFSDGSKSYFALKHPGPVADFHNKEGFVHSL
ncbi:MAG: DOMON-like domain-containing protein [Bacillota bacterium]